MRAALRYLAEIHDEIPAFRAGFFVVSLILAALLNFGVFALLIIGHMALDVVKYREYHRCSWRLTWRGTIRESAADIMLLSLGLCIALVLSASPGFQALHFSPSVRLTLASFLGILVSKLLILLRFMRVLLNSRGHLRAKSFATRSAWTAGEQFNLFFAFFLLGILTILILRNADDTWFLQWLSFQVLPWKI